MNAERLLAHFERISEAPDAIARLRRFILDLAVRGKLVEQDPEDEPAEEQLERITLAKLALGRKERAFKKKKSDMSIESFRYLLPSGWASATLADLVTILNGRAYKQSELLDSGTPVLRVGNLFTSNKWYYSNLELDDDKCIDDGDLIFAWSASFGPFVRKGGRVIYHYHIWKLPLHSPADLSLDYLYLYLLHKTAEIKGAGPVSFRNDASFALQVLPSLTTTPTQIKQLRQTILNLAVRGKLVEQDPEDEPAEELVRLIAEDKKLRMAERRIRAPRNAHSVNSEDVPLDLPPSWKTFPLGDISLVSDPNPSHRYPSYDGGTVPILSTQEFSGLDGWNPSTAKLVQREFHDYQVDSCNFEPGDIVFARKGRIGLPRFLPSLERYAFSHTVFIVKPLCGVYPQYLLWALRRQAVVDWLTKEMNQNTGVPTLGKDKTERIPIPLPPLSEQHRIVAKVDELMALCDQLEQQLSQADQQRRRLLEAVLAEALGGRLTVEEESHANVA
ncbi:MAG: restriction endonuclease subunit S [Cyanobacteria bacterium]|nr:restriction endonuclease subunit S [Cyanobacteriota bacterium]